MNIENELQERIVSARKKVRGERVPCFLPHAGLAFDGSYYRLPIFLPSCPHAERAAYRERIQRAVEALRGKLVNRSFNQEATYEAKNGPRQTARDQMWVRDAWGEYVLHYPTRSGAPLLDAFTGVLSDAGAYRDCRSPQPNRVDEVRPVVDVFLKTRGHSLKSLRLEAVVTMLDGAERSSEMLKLQFQSSTISFLLPAAILCPRGDCTLAGCFDLFKQHFTLPVAGSRANPFVSFLERRLL